MSKTVEQTEIENVNTPGRVERVDKRKYSAMKDALIKVLPRQPPGLTVAEAKEKLLPLLPDNLFPGGDKAGW